LLVLITISTAPIDSQVANRGETRALPYALTAGRALTSSDAL